MRIGSFLLLSVAFNSVHSSADHAKPVFDNSTELAPTNESGLETQGEPKWAIIAAVVLNVVLTAIGFGLANIAMDCSFFATEAGAGAAIEEAAGAAVESAEGGAIVASDAGKIGDIEKILSTLWS
ncbi:hypothetical protein HDU98_001673 [Podochytrium sp. JEL0797]|nr:hypothetical protein HDU98_001673 [Podochytrium sp. JEL0797]